MFNLTIEGTNYHVSFKHFPKKLRPEQKKKATLCVITKSSAILPKEFTIVGEGVSKIHKSDRVKFSNSTLRMLGLRKSLHRALENIPEITRPQRLLFFDALVTALQKPLLAEREKTH